MSVGDANAKAEIAKAANLPLEGSSFTSIGPTVQKETVDNAVKGLIIASLFIVLYLAFRFGIAVGGIKNGLKFGAAAVIALVHDVLFVFGTAGIVGYFLHWEISSLFITAVLTVIGFSVHDTIIIFDRIRENLKRQHKGETFEHLCDHSVTQSVARSINTSMSAIIPLGVLIAIGTPTPELKFMCLSMLLGIAIGAYSSIFNATPILYLWNKAVMKKRGEGAGLMAEAAQELKVKAQLAAAAAAGMGPGSQAPAVGPTPGSAYGQVKRRSTAVESAKQVIDEDEK
jgi:SecD/SecF fusion protein